MHEQVARSRTSDSRVWTRAHDYLGLLSDPGVSLSILGPSKPASEDAHNPGTVDWSQGRNKMVAHIPFYILREQEGLVSIAFFHPLSLLSSYPCVFLCKEVDTLGSLCSRILNKMTD